MTEKTKLTAVCTRIRNALTTVRNTQLNNSALSADYNTITSKSFVLDLSHQTACCRSLG